MDIKQKAGSQRHQDTGKSNSRLYRQGAVFCVLGVLAAHFAGCDNHPHPPPLQEKRADGAQWRVSYRSLGDDPRTLDPQVSYDTLGHAVIAQLYECLLQYHPFKVDPYELVPCLAEIMPQRVKHPDGRESYLFKLKRGIYFHDDSCFTDSGGIGREVTAEDIAYAFKRIADPKVECPVVSTLQDYVVGLKDVYTEAQKTGRLDYSKSLPGIEVVDRHTFRLNLLKAYPQILYWLAMPFTAPVPREAVEYYDGKRHGDEIRPLFRFHPVGTGPFRLVEWQKSRLIRMARHERYTATAFPTGGWPAEEDDRFKPDTGKPIPFLDEIQFPIIRETIPRWRLFRQGYLEGVGVNKDVFNTVLNMSHELTLAYRERGVRLYKDVEPTTFYLVFNMEDGVLGKNKKLRQAISSAYDEELDNQIFANGINVNAQQLLPPGVFGSQANFRNPYKQHDLALARRLMAEAGYPEGIERATGKPLELKLDAVTDDPQSRQHTEFQKNQIEQLGIRVKVVENTWARLQEKVDSGDFQIVGYGWHADYPDPENFFFLFCGRYKPPQGSNNSRYSNPEFDRIFQKMSTMDNTPEREQLIHQLNAMLTEDCPVMFLSHPVYFSLNQPWAPRVSSNPLLAGGIKYAKIDPDLRARCRREWNTVSWWPLWGALGLTIACGVFTVRWSRSRHV